MKIYNLSYSENMKNLFFVLTLMLVSAFNLFAQFGSQDSGGKLSPFEACYDVKYYDINLRIDPADKAIGGFTIMKAAAVNDFNKIFVDLDQVYAIDNVQLIDGSKEISLKFTHDSGKVWIDFPQTIKSSELFTTKIIYSGMPRVAKRPPWDDGFVWQKTKGGIDWDGVACEGGGADIWWPCKDHPSDEPDSVSLHYTVPKDLICVANGKMKSVVENNDGTKTWNWFVSTPINNYCVTFYLGPYKEIKYEYTSIDGTRFPFNVYCLPENYEKAKEHSPEFLTHMKIMEELCGPYPFREDKYAVVEAPYLGMEHQTAIAYGYGWKDMPQFNFDWLHQHEFSHEWWGNLVTAKDWSDFWIHEGIGTYMQPLYLEKVFGKDQYFAYMESIKRFSNKQPVAPREVKTAGESYDLDIYYKGAWVVHTLRYYLGDSVFFKVLRRWAYPTAEMEKIKDGRQCRLATTDDMVKLAEKVSGKKLDWFFEVYLRHAPLPILNVTRAGNKVELSWDTEDNLPFPLPVDVEINGKTQLVEMSANKGELVLPEGAKYKIDPDDWILKKIVEK